MLFIFIILLLALLLLGGAYYAYQLAFCSPKEKRNYPPTVKGSQYDPYRDEMRSLYHRLKDLPCEFVSITSQDGLTLSGRYYHVEDGAPLDIGFHGYRSTPLRDFCGGSVLSFSLGHNLLLVDQRAHGRSQGRTISFGIKERRDLLCWIDYAIGRFGANVPIFLHGVSMGGATVLMASEFDLPLNVRGIVADCPYSSAMDVILHVGRTMPIPNWLIRPFVILGARIFGGFDIYETDARRAVQNSKIPILILHGESDSFVPSAMSDLQSLNPRMVRRYTFPGAEHGISFLVDGPRYNRIVTEFVNKTL